MTAIQTISSPDRKQWSALFHDVPALRTCVASVLEGRCGRLLASPGGHGTAWIEAPPFLFPVGDVEGPVAEAFFESVGAAGGVVVGAGRWLVEIERRWAGRTLRAPRTPYSAEGLDVGHLQSLATIADEDTEIVRMDEELARIAVAEIDHDLVFPASFSDPKAFAAGGIGFCVLLHGKPVSAATSAFISSDAIEVQVNTHPGHRSRGLATRASAALLAWCLEHGLTPGWDTGDDASRQLARRLGYRELPGYEMLVVAPRAVPQ